jgi:hypothetical protein
MPLRTTFAQTLTSLTATSHFEEYFLGKSVANNNKISKNIGFYTLGLNITVQSQLKYASAT